MSAKLSHPIALVRTVLILVFLLPFLPVNTIKANGPVYVDADAVGANNGASWTDAYVFLQDALDYTNNNGSTDFEIWVAEGVYYPDEDIGTEHTDNIQTETFLIEYDNVKLYGGFSGGETELSQRDWETYLTILSGDIDGDDTNTDGNHIAESWTHIVDNNAYHVLYLDGASNESITADVVIDGFIITAGDTFPPQGGGGIYCDALSSGAECNPTFRNLEIIGNRANMGGGVFLGASNGGISNPTFTFVSFTRNYSTGYGGGVYSYVASDPASSSALYFSNCHFLSNHAVEQGGGLYAYSAQGSSSAILVNVEFIVNIADVYGGGIGTFAEIGGSIYYIITNNNFYANQAMRGGGIYNRVDGPAPHTMNINNTILWANVSSQEGGQIYNDDMSYPTRPSISHSDIQGSGGSGGSWDIEIGIDVGNNIDQDPEFTSPCGGDYSLQSTSPAIDAGNAGYLPNDNYDLDEDGNNAEVLPLDLVLNTRVVNSDVDMGAYEHGPLPREDFIGMYSRGQKTWYLKDANDDGWGNVTTVRFGSTDSSWIPVVGDWDGNNADTIGIYSRTQKTWYLKDANNDGWGNVTTVRFGSTDSSWLPVVGDWDGDGTDTIGMYSRTQKTWYLKDANDDGWSNVQTVRFGSVDTSWSPVVGDWNGNGTDTIAMYSRTQKTWYLKSGNTDGWGDVSTVRFGSTDTSWIPVAGDWDGDSTDTIGMYSRTQKTWYLKDTNTDGWGDVTTVRFGSIDTSWAPVSGKW